MTNQKTRRALVGSIIALILCFSMLLGTTFAWFTDSVTSTGNIIQTGKLKVGLHYADGTEALDDDTTWNDASDVAIFKYDLWEPGYVDVKHIKISNDGTLALKYQISIEANGDASELAKVIDVYFIDGGQQIATREDLDALEPVGTLEEVLATMPASTSGDLLTGETDVVTIALKMQEDAGNDYQEKSIGTTFSIKLLATQLAAESDAFDENYDADAKYTVTYDSADALAAALAAGETISDTKIVLTENVTGTIEIAGTLENVVIEGTGENVEALRFNVMSTASMTDVTMTKINTTYADSSSVYVDGGAVNIDAGATVKNLVISDSVFNGSGSRSCVVGVSEASAEVTLSGCEVTGPKYVVYASAPMAKVTLDDCDLTGISSWIVMMNASDTVGSQVTINKCKFTECTGGIAKMLGGGVIAEGGSFVFTKNVLLNSTGHDGKDAQWFAINVTTNSVESTVSGNTLNNADWTPASAQGLN